MDDAKETVTVNVMQHEISVACTPAERANLLDAAAYLDRRLREVSANKRAMNNEHLAVITALNISGDFLKLQKAAVEHAALAERLEELHRQVDDVVTGIRNAVS